MLDMFLVRLYYLTKFIKNVGYSYSWWGSNVCQI